MEKQVKVSVIMPSLNVGKYITQCVDSVLKQTLQELEVIFVDAGSTDGTLEILKAYTEQDSRTRLIQSDKKSYGYQVNLGFDAACGEYLGIIETDDYADPEMFETLYNTAKKDDLDVCKSGFYYYWSKDGERNEPNPIVSEAMSKRVSCPLTEFSVPLEQAEFFNIKPTIWSAVYKRSFIYDNGIRLNETPGASYQDASFNFKVWTCAKRVRLLTDCFLHYRQDNEASSINSPGKVYCICDEYEEMERFLQLHPVEQGKLEPVLNRLKYDSYLWNYTRLSEALREEFLTRFHDDFEQANAEGKLYKTYFEWFRWNDMMMVIREPEEFAKKRACEAAGIKYVHPKEAGSVTKRARSKLVGGWYCIKEHGLLYTIRLALKRLFGRDKA